MNNLYLLFAKCSEDIKRWLEKQSEVKEETLTDWLLYTLSEAMPIIKYKQFTRYEEGTKTGADWEWWFIFPNNKSFSCRIQAKKLKIVKDNYAGIAYTNNGQLQIERFIIDCKKDGFASFYSFYCSDDTCETMCGRSLSDEGVFLGEANEIYNQFFLQNPRRSLYPIDILKFTNPLSCLFCCPLLLGKVNILDGFKEYIKHYYTKYLDNEIQEIGFKDTPTSILQLLSSNKVEDWWEKEYQTQFKKTNAILVVDLRDYFTT